MSTTPECTVETITVPTDCKHEPTKEVEVTVMQGTGLAYHRRVVFEEKGFRSWHVTHLATKKRFPLEFNDATEARAFILQITKLIDYVPAMPVIRTLDEKQSWLLLGLVAYGVHTKVQIEAEQEAS